MRNLMRAMILGTLVMSFYGCGKTEDSGSKKKSISAVGTVYQDFNTLRSAFTNSAMNTGLTTNSVVYHIGPQYGGTFSSSSFSASAVFCVFGENLFGNDDKCSQSGSSTSQLNDVIDMGEYKVIKSSTTSSVSFDLATSVANNTFGFEAKTFNSSDSIFRKMLNLDEIATEKIVVTEAFIKMSSGGQVKANFVEYFFTDGTYEGYILSAALPIMANPVVSYKGNFSINGGVSFKMEGRLNNVGQNILTGVSAQSHRLETDVYSGTYQIKVVNAFQIR